MPILANNRLVQALQSRTVDQFYGDTATIVQTVVDTLDVYGQPSTTTVTSTGVPCSFTDKPDEEKWKNYTDISQLSAEIRYAGTPAPAAGNTVTLTGRYGDADFTDTTYEVIGIQDRGAMGVLVALRKVAI